MCFHMSLSYRYLSRGIEATDFLTNFDAEYKMVREKALLDEFVCPIIADDTYFQN